MSRFSKILSGSYLHFSPFAGEYLAVARELQLPTLAGLILELVKDTLLARDSTGDIPFLLSFSFSFSYSRSSNISFRIANILIRH